MPYVYRHFISQNAAPKGSSCIGVYDGNGKKVCTIPLGGLTPPNVQPLYSFGLVSDCHTFLSLTNWDGNTKLDNALSYFEEQGCAMVIGCGDFTQTGFYRKNETGGNITLPDGTVVPNNTVYFDDRQMVAYRDILAKHEIPVFELFGNHENMNAQSITLHLDLAKAYTGIPATSYTVTNNPATDENTGTNVRPNRQITAVGDDLFILCGQPRDAYVMSDDDFTWLSATLEANKSRRCFVFVHAYIEEDSGDPLDVRENSIFETWGTSNKSAFMELIRQYDNVILFHGHSHMKFQCQEYDTNANYTERNGFKSVHVPSLGVPRDINFDTNTSKDAYAESQGYIVDVYDDCVVLNGWDFIGNKPVPLGTYKIDTIKVENGFPYGYTILDYVQCNKDKRYDTGIVCDQDTILEITFTREDSDAAYLYGVRNSDNTASVTAYMSNSGAWRFGNKYKNYTLTLNTVHTAKVQKSGITIDGAKTSFTSSNFTANATLLVGTSRGTSGGLASAQFIGKIYSLKLYDGSELILDWIPCINPDGITGFYDTVGNKFVSPIL